MTNKQILEEKMVVIKTLDDKLAEMIDDEKDFEAECMKTGDYNRSVLKVIVEITRWLKGSTEKKPGGEEDSRNRPLRTQAKLPKLTLKKYNGDPLLYHTFWDSFESAVHKNESLDDISKFNYLKGLLEGKASLAVQGLTLTSDNYMEAVNLLEKRFGDPQVIITAHMDALWRLFP